MSDSEGGLPSATVISNKLRDVVIAIHKSGNNDDLTVKRVRARAEKELGLDEGFFKTDSSWKRKSQDEIVDAVDKYCHADATPQPTPKKAAAKPKAKLAEKKAKATTGVKRKAAPAKKPAKRRKPSSEEESEAELSEPSAELSAEESDQTKKKPARRANKVIAEDSDSEDSAPKPAPKPIAPIADDESDAEPAPPAKQANPPAADLDSDLSSVIDEPVKKQRKKKTPSAPTAKKPPKPKPTKPTTPSDPDTAKIKDLQSWLLKCGIRKIWSRDPELAKCSTASQKITVLKNMLRDVGMEGKFSVEKAAKIKEQREFAKDLEAIKEGEAAWGKSNEVTSTGRPSRRAAARAVPVQRVVLEDDSEGGEESGGDSDGDGDEDVEMDGDEEEESDGKEGDSGGDDSE